MKALDNPRKEEEANRLMADPPADPTLAGRMIITARDYGDGIMIPEVSFDPPGKINQGWFNRHQHLFLREIQRALVGTRTGISRRLFNENGARQ